MDCQEAGLLTYFYIERLVIQLHTQFIARIIPCKPEQVGFVPLQLLRKIVRQVICRVWFVSNSSLMAKGAIIIMKIQAAYLIVKGIDIAAG